MNIQEMTRQMKLASPQLAAASREQRDRALALIREALMEQRGAIFAANRRDMDRADEEEVSPALKSRMKFDEAKLRDVCAGIGQLIDLPDPVGRTLLKRSLDEGLTLEKVSCPLGVIGIIFEARPDALVQISSLCIKSGNCAVLKGGRETAETNRVLFETIHSAAVLAGLDPHCLFQAQEHSEIEELLACQGSVDLLIPRGSNRFVQYIMEHTRIPVMGHAEGVCHIYVDDCAQADRKLDLITDAKAQYPAACNAVEMLLVRRSIAREFLPLLAGRMKREGIRLRATQEAAAFLGGGAQEPFLTEEEFHKEYSDLVLGVRLVEDTADAAQQINRYGSHHTDCILTEDDEAAEYFMRMVDSAGVYRNCSTRFADGFRYGFGAEVGISTGKLHARGPVGLEGLVTYKYLLRGKGQIVGDYASGKRQFHFADL